MQHIRYKYKRTIRICKNNRSYLYFSIGRAFFHSTNVEWYGAARSEEVVQKTTTESDAHDYTHFINVAGKVIQYYSRRWLHDHYRVLSSFEKGVDATSWQEKLRQIARMGKCMQITYCETGALTKLSSGFAKTY